MKLKVNPIAYMLIVFCILALSIVSYVIFKYPQSGVADQGDFNRIMSVSGLQLAQQYKNTSSHDRFFNYIVTEYKISSINIKKNLIKLSATSMAYLILLISFICKMFGQGIFKTEYLAAVYAAVYVLSIFLILKYINIKKKTVLVFLTLISTFVFFDGNYLVWFNSLYGEPMMITTLMLYIAAWVYYIYHKNVLKSDKNMFLRIIFIFTAAFLFLGSKMQVISALPVVLAMLGEILWHSRHTVKPYQLGMLILLLCILAIYPVKIGEGNKNISRDTQYNSVFYGILKDSKNPGKDLLDMGLNPDMAVEAGKHSYLDKSKYIKYVPRSPITEREFYSKMTSGKLIKFYTTHPMRFVRGMEYTASRAFFTGTSLGKYEKSYSTRPVSEFNRFTLWSSLRNSLLPKNLIFIITVYIIVSAVSLFIYNKNKESQEIKDRIKLLWSIMLIGLLQFPMPYIGNGQADTKKQLYLFNFVFDIILVVSACWIFEKLEYFKSLKKKLILRNNGENKDVDAKG